MIDRYNSGTAKDKYELIIDFMKESNACATPLKTREIADGCKISVYMALNYLRELHRQHIVEPDRGGRGRTIYWSLVS